MGEVARFWTWFKGDRAAWVGVAVSFIAWGVFSLLIAQDEWRVTGASWVAMLVQLGAYMYVLARFISAGRDAKEHEEPETILGDEVTRAQVEGRAARWWLSEEAAKLTQPVGGLGIFITVIGALGEFAPGVLAALGGGFTPGFIRASLIIGPLVTLCCMRLLLAQAKHGKA